MKWGMVWGLLAVIGFTATGISTLLLADFDLFGTDTRDNTALVLSSVTAIVLVFLILFAALQIDGTDQAKRLKNSLCKDSYRPLYTDLMGFALPRVRRWFRVPVPVDGNHSVLTLLGMSFTYHLVDRALLLAVIYPVLALLLFWGTTGQDGTLGGEIVLPAVDTPWQGVILVGALICALGAPHYANWPSARRNEENGRVFPLLYWVPAFTILVVLVVGASNATAGMLALAMLVAAFGLLPGISSGAWAMACAIAISGIALSPAAGPLGVTGVLAATSVLALSCAVLIAGAIADPLPRSALQVVAA